MRTKADQLRNSVFRAILRGDYAPGDRIPTEREMAAETGLGRVTVRRAYARLEEAGILTRTQGRGTHIATAARGHAGSCDFVALLSSVRTAFGVASIKAFETAISDSDSLLLLKLTEDDPAMEEASAIDLVGKGIRNLILWPSGQEFASGTFERLRILGTNMVFFDRALPGGYADFVGLDNEHAMATLVGWVAARGRSDVVFVSHDGPVADSDTQRRAALVRECTQCGLGHSELRVPQVGGAEPSAVHEELARHDRAAALICVNDAVALGVRPLVPDDVPVLGIDGSDAAFRAGIPSYEQPIAEMAERAVSLLARQRKKGEKWQAKQVYCRGQLRESGSDVR